eukprot:6479981-Amphidinium_carterae.2
MQHITVVDFQNCVPLSSVISISLIIGDYVFMWGTDWSCITFSFELPLSDLIATVLGVADWLVRKADPMAAQRLDFADASALQTLLLISGLERSAPAPAVQALIAAEVHHALVLVPLRANFLPSWLLRRIIRPTAGGFRLWIPRVPNMHYPEDPTQYAQPTAPALDADGLPFERDIPKDVARVVARRKREQAAHEHTTGSMMLLVFALLLACFHTLALTVPYWRGNKYGIALYPMPRYYGFFHVKGMTMKWHHLAAEHGCAAYGGLRFFNGCVTPICLQYQKKCRAYNEMMYVGYTLGAIYAHSTIIMFVCIYWTFMLTVRKMRWAALWWKIAVFLDVISIAGYVLFSEGMFATMNQEAMYPEQGLYFCFYIDIVLCVGLMLAAYIAGNIRDALALKEKELSEQYDSDEEDADARYKLDTE